MKGDWKKFVDQQVAGLCEAFTRQASVVTFRAYQVGLDGLTAEQIGKAVAIALRSCKFMPSPAELRELAGEMKSEDRAVQAWIVFEKAVCTIGYVRGVDFDDPVVNATVRALGGWDRCCQQEGDEFDVFLRKRFLDTYASLSRSGVGEEQAAPLEGGFDRENRRLGQPVKPPHKVAVGLPPAPGAVRISQVPTKAGETVVPRVVFQRP